MANSLPEQIAQRIIDDYINVSADSRLEALPNVRDLSQEYGVSNSTISYALTLLQQQGLVSKKHGRGTRILPRDQELRKELAPVIGFLVPWVSRNELVMHLYEGVESSASRFGYQVLVGSSGESYENEQRKVQEMCEAGCRGIVMFPVARPMRSLRNDYLLSEFQDLPIALVDIAYPEQKRSQVVFDNYHAAYEITQKLIEEGHERIAYSEFLAPQGSTWHRSCQDRFAGIRDAFRDLKLPRENLEKWQLGWLTEFESPEIREWLSAWKKRKKRPTALVARQDHHAASVIHCAHQLGIRIPEDLRVVGFDNLTIGTYANPPLPTTNPDFRKAGRIAAEMCIKEIRGDQKPPLNYMLPVPVLWQPLKAEAQAPANTEAG